jgi:hypothetical protein
MQEYQYFVAHEFSEQDIIDLRRAIEEAFEGTDLKPYYADLGLYFRENQRKDSYGSIWHL